MSKDKQQDGQISVSKLILLIIFVAVGFPELVIVSLNRGAELPNITSIDWWKHMAAK